MPGNKPKRIKNLKMTCTDIEVIKNKKNTEKQY
jgi:hypothetical protein